MFKSIIQQRCHLSNTVHAFETVERILTKSPSMFTPSTRVEVSENSSHSLTAAIPMPIKSAKTRLASLTLTLPFGSRFEGIKFQGYSHLLRTMSFKSTKNLSQMMLLRLAESQGCHLEAIHDRDHLILYAESLQEDIEFIAKVFAETFSCIKWEDHELEAAKSQMTLEALRFESSARDTALEALHKELFEFTELGSSLLCPSWRPSELTKEKLSLFKLGQIQRSASISHPWYSLTSIGLDLEKVNILDKTYLLPSLNSLISSNPTRIIAHEDIKSIKDSNFKTLHIEKGVDSTTLGIAFKVHGYSQLSLTDKLKFLILNEIFSETIPVPYGNPVGKWSSKAIDPKISITCEFHQYSNAGLFGFTLSVPKASHFPLPDRALIDAGKVLLRNDLLFNITEEEFRIAKASAKLRIAQYPENIRSLSIGIGKNILNKPVSFLPSISEMINTIESIDVNSIKALQKSIFSHRPSSVLVGPTLTGASL